MQIKDLSTKKMCDVSFISWFITEKSKIIMHKYLGQIWLAVVEDLRNSIYDHKWN